jgi:hypothetical protein
VADDLRRAEHGREQGRRLLETTNRNRAK